MRKGGGLNRQGVPAIDLGYKDSRSQSVVLFQVMGVWVLFLAFSLLNTGKQLPLSFLTWAPLSSHGQDLCG